MKILKFKETITSHARVRTKLSERWFKMQLSITVMINQIHKKKKRDCKQGKWVIYI